MMMRLAGVLLGISVFVSLPLSAQTEPEVALSDSVAVNYVMVPFTALGPKGAPITNLRQREVTLLVDGKPVAIDLFEKSQNAPVSFSILVDGSGSMALAGKMDAARVAIQALLANQRKGDEFGLFMFDDREVHEIVPFTEDGAAIVRGLAEIKPYGKTAFFDAIARLPQREELGKNATRAIILISDGIDNASRLTRLQLSAKLEGVTTPIYTIAPRDPALPKPAGKRLPESLTDIDTLEHIAASSGGKLFFGTRPQHFTQAIATINADLRAQYLIGFPPTGKGVVKFRKIALKAASRVRSVRVRAGYNGTEPPSLNAARTSATTAKKGN